jgi:WD40 repeat protein
VGIAEIIEDGLSVTVWNTQDGTARPPVSLELPVNASSDDLEALALIPDGTRLAAIWLGGSISQIWELETAARVTSLSMVDDSLGPFFTPFSRVGGEASFRIGVPSYVTMSPDGKRLFSINRGGSFLVWDIETGEQVGLFTVAGPDVGIFDPSISLSPNARLLAIAAENYVDIRDLETGRSLSLFVPSANAHLSALAFSLDNTMLAAASDNGLIKIWDVETLELNGVSRHLITLADPGSIVHDLEFSSDGHRLATAAGDGTIKLWDIRAGGGVELPFLRQDLFEEEQAALSISLSPDGKRMAVAGQTGSAAVYDVEGGERLFQLGVSHLSPVVQIKYSPDGLTIATCGFAGPFQIWDASNGAELLRLDDYTDGACSFDHHPDGSSLTLGFFKNGTGWYQDMILPELQPGKLVEVDPVPSFEWQAPHEGETTSLSFNNQGSLLAITSGSGELFIWNKNALSGGADPGLPMQPGDNEALLVREGRNFLEVRFSPTENYLVVTGIGGSVYIWDVEKAQIIRTIAAHDGRITAVTISHGGRWLATGGVDRVVRLWDFKTGDAFLSLTGQTAIVTDLAFSPDGKRLFAAGDDGTVRPYALGVDELIDLAQSRVSRSLTDEECRQYLHVEACPVAD